MPTSRRSAFTTAHGVSYRVLSHAANMRFSAHPTLTACLSNLDVHVFDIADLAHRGSAFGTDPSNFAAGQSDLGPIALTGVENGRIPSTSAEFSAPAGDTFQIVNGHPNRNGRQRHAITDAGFHVVSADDPIAGLQTFRGQDVTQFAIVVFQERNSTGTIGVVLNVRHFRGDIVFVATEINSAVHPLVTAAAKASSDFALVVPSAGTMKRFEKGFLGLFLAVGDLGKIADRAAAPSGAGGPVFSDSHCLTPRRVGDTSPVRWSVLLVQLENRNAIVLT
jgi:hypothetical protein